MVLTTIDLENFRLHKNTSLYFSNQLNYIIGGNGQGKTSLLEAIYYLCTTKNLNRYQDNDVVSFNKSFFKINGKFNNITSNTVQVQYDSINNKKSVIVDGKQIYRSSNIIGKFPVVTLTQSDHSITLGSPSDRRKFIDSVISQASDTYLKLLLEYNRILRQRSSLLIHMKETNNKSFTAELIAWTEMLIKNGVEIIKHRVDFINRFNDHLISSYKKVIEERENPIIDYEFLWHADTIEEIFTEKLDDLRDEELNRGLNLYGPHRDDFIFKINNKELKRYGSQGQHKTFQIALRFGEFFYLKDITGKKPIFLLDDVFGELDSYRSIRISNYLKKIGQAFVTMTDFTKIDNLIKTESDSIIMIELGKVKYAEGF